MKTVRVVKHDDLNFGIEILKEYPAEQKDGTPHPKAGESYWSESTYYGSKLHWALEVAALMGMDTGEVKAVSEAFAKAAKSVPVVERRNDEETESE